MLTWGNTRLTGKEADQALLDAGINPNVATWNDEILDKATTILENAQNEKIRRMTKKELKNIWR